MKNKKIKDMTPEEYKEYKREYQKKYYAKKKKKESDEKKKNISRKLTKKQKNVLSDIIEDDIEKNNKNLIEFSKLKESDSYIFNPNKDGMPGIFCPQKMLSCHELFTRLNIDVKKQIANITGVIRIHDHNSSKFAKTKKDIFICDVSKHIDKLNNRNYYKYCLQFTIDYINKLNKMFPEEYCSFMIDNAEDKNLMAFVLFSCIDRKYREKQDIVINDLITDNIIKKKRKKLK